MPGDNLVCERGLSVFDTIAEKSAKCSNHKFKAKSIRDDLTLPRVDTAKKIQMDIKKLLDEREEDWTKAQKALNKERLEGIIEAGRERCNYVDQVLKKCKKWGGPFTSIEEMRVALVNVGNQEKVIRNIPRH